MDRATSDRVATTDSHEPSRPREAAGAGATEGYGAAGRPVVCRGRDAVDATEQLVCGHGAVASAAVAEGLALAGRRSANLLGADEGLPAAAPMPRAARVHHRVADVQLEGTAQTVFELVAGSVQEAVDHCLVAHHLVAQLGEAGTCTVGSAIADRLAVVRLPSVAAVEAIPGRDEDDVSPPRASQAAPGAFEEVSGALGRPCAPVIDHHPGEADVAIVAVGDARRHAVELCDAARRAGASCRVVGIAMVRPFPYDDLRERLSGAKRVVVVEDASRGPGWLSGGVRVTVTNGAPGPEVVAVASDATLDEVLGALGREDLVGTATVSSSISPSVTVAASPAGEWGRGLVRSVVAELGWLGPVSLDEHGVPGGLSAIRVARGSTARGGKEADVLVVAGPETFEPAVVGPALARGAHLIVLSDAGTDSALWASLSPEQRVLVEDQELVLRGVDTASLTRQSAGHRDALDALLVGALLEAAGPLTRVVDVDGSGLTGAVATAVEESVGGRLAALLRDGSRAVFPVEDRDAPPAEQPAATAIRMPAAADHDESWDDILSSFHLEGRRERRSLDPASATPLWPAILEAVVGADRVYHDYPLYLPVADGGLEGAPVPLAELLEQALAAMEEAGETHDALDGQLPRMVRAFAQQVEAAGGSVAAFDDLRDEALVRFADEFDLSDAARDEMRDQVKALRKQLPSEGSLLALDETTLVRLHVAALRRARRQRVAALHEEIRSTVAKLSDMLHVDDLHDPQGTTAESFGSAGAEMFDTAALGSQLASQKGSQRLTPERRARIETALAVLRHRLAARGHADVLIVHPGTLSPEAIIAGATKLEHPAALEVAQGLFDGLVTDMVEVFRALRLARLEIEGGYDPARHAAALAAFDADAMTAEELLAVPAVVVLETARRLRGPSLAPLSEVLRSGRPIHVVVTDSPWEPDDSPAEGWSAALGHLAVAHREALVVSSTLGRPSHLSGGLERMASSLRPSVAVVGVPGRTGPVPATVRLTAAHEGRATPCFVYDPDAGESWADRLDLTGNPQPEETWPTHELRYEDDQGAEQTLPSRLTFAAVAALEPALRTSFRVVPPEGWSDDQLEMADYLDAWDRGETDGKLPFLWVVEPDGTLARAVATRELAFAALDRARAWHTLQELGGVNNEWARRAADAARQATLAEAEAERAQLAQEHEATLAEVRAGAANEAMQRLVDVLMDLDSAPVPRATSTVAAAAPLPAPEPVGEPAEGTAPAAAEVPAAEPEEDDLSFDEAYIDTPLCTTCNECTNLNPRMFKYDGNKQAFIADATAGTFLELVVAAEKCPANIIHPGAPRPDDSTATPDVVARAEPYS